MKKEDKPVNYEQCHSTARRLGQMFLMDMTETGGVSKKEAARAFADFTYEEGIRYNIIIHKYDLSENLTGLRFREAKENWVELTDLKRRRKEMGEEIRKKSENSVDYCLFAVAMRQLLRNVENMGLDSAEMQAIRQNVIYTLRDGLKPE
jgi:hypothetical protein